MPRARAGSAASASAEASANPSTKELHLLDPQRAQSIGIMLSHIRLPVSVRHPARHVATQYSWDMLHRALAHPARSAAGTCHGPSGLAVLSCRAAAAHRTAEYAQAGQRVVVFERRSRAQTWRSIIVLRVARRRSLAAQEIKSAIMVLDGEKLQVQSGLSPVAIAKLWPNAETGRRCGTHA